jgi:deoxyribodipyrimidine photo-lyase
MTKTSVLWFRRDLRLQDHPALAAAAADGHRVLGVFLADDVPLTASGPPRRAFLAAALAALNATMGGNLLVVHGRPASVIPRIARSVEAAAVHVTGDYGPYGRRRDAAVADALADAGIAWVATGSPYAISPGRVRKGDGGRFAVFTPFFRAWTHHGWRGPADSGSGVDWIPPADVHGVTAHDPAEYGRAVPSGMTLPDAGEQAASAAWAAFLADRVDAYDGDRDRPDRPGTSRMSVHLKWGCVHPRTLLADLAGRGSAGAASYRRELAWREFYADTVFHLPASVWTSVDPVIQGMAWDSGATADARFEAWRAGRTGYPYIDAGLRQLLAEGWMHNRLRMATASFLIKDLHLPWQRGAEHFLEHLVDGDYASNNHGWQWVAGSGPQAAPFFRIFNPLTQGEKFDPSGDFVRTYVPELRDIPGRKVHRPWELAGGVPAGYPEPIVDHAEERAEALRRWEAR